MCVKSVCSVFVLVFVGFVNCQFEWDPNFTDTGFPNVPNYMHHDSQPPFGPLPNYADDPKPPDRHYPVQHAGLPRKLEVFPLPLKDSDHELMFNVSWIPSMGGVARDYSLEVRSVTDTIDCQTPMCYEYNIPGEATWWLIPAFSNPIAEMCAVRPGCAYMVRLIAHPWDGHTSANLHVELDECVVGVCSCAHSPRLPVPSVSTQAITIQGEIFANITWTLPKPSYPQRLPSAKLGKQSYIVSLGKQMVSDSHPAPWFANTITRRVDADGLMAEGDTPRWLLLPVSERSVERSGERSGRRGEKRFKNVMPDVKLLARVFVVDDRGCFGPAGNATAFDPAAPTSSKFSFGTYAILAALGGAWLMGAVFALSARVVKRVLKSFRSAPVSAPLEPLSHRPAWFPLQLRTGMCKFQCNRGFQTFAREHLVAIQIKATRTSREVSTAEVTKLLVVRRRYKPRKLDVLRRSGKVRYKDLPVEYTYEDVPP